MGTVATSAEEMSNEPVMIRCRLLGADPSESKTLSVSPLDSVAKVKVMILRTLIDEAVEWTTHREGEGATTWQLRCSNWADEPGPPLEEEGECDPIAEKPESLRMAMKSRNILLVPDALLLLEKATPLRKGFVSLKVSP